jgi:hypothetical protein
LPERSTKRIPKVERESALSAVPHRLPPIEVRERDNGGLEVVVAFDRPGWHRFLGASGRAERTFGMDTLGRFVYEACTGEATVGDISAGFAAHYRVTGAEAEIAVSRFLKTLMSKGLVAMEIEGSAD